MLPKTEKSETPQTLTLFYKTNSLDEASLFYKMKLAIAYVYLRSLINVTINYA